MANVFAACAILLFIIHHAISEPLSNNILSSLYKKAAAENRPLVLVLDGDKLTSKKDLVKQQAQNYWPYKRVKAEHRHGINPTGSLIHHRNFRSEKSRERDRQWLRSFRSRYDRNNQDDRDRRDKDQRYRNMNDRDRRDRDDRDRRDRDDWDRRDRYRNDDRHNHDRYDDRHSRDRDDDRNNRYRDDDRRDRDRYDRDRRDRNRDDNRDDDRRDRYRDDRDRREHDRYVHYDSSERDVPSLDRTLRQLIEKTLNKSKDEEDPHTRAIQSSVIKQLLRANNYFNCNAQEKCKLKCQTENKKYNCNNKCEQKFECEQESQSDCDDCDSSGSCGDGECNPSTKGVPKESESVECKHCKK